MLKWLEIDQDKQHTKFSALNVNFSSPGSDPLCSWRPAHAGVKKGYLFKKGYFTAVGSSSVKQLQIDTDMLLIITSTSDELFSCVNIKHLE